MDPALWIETTQAILSNWEKFLQMQRKLKKKQHRYGYNTKASLQTKNGEISSVPVDFFVFRLAFMLQISCGVGGSKESEGSTGLVKQVL